MKRMSLFAACLLFTACGLGEGDLFRRGFPTADMVKLELPAKSSTQQGLEGTGTMKQGLEGEIADFYRITRGATLGVNTGVGAVLGLLKTITDHPATTVNGNTAIWGPHTGDLARNTWRLTVTKVGPQEYTYALDGKAKQDPDTAFVTVLSGSHQPALDPNGDPIEGLGAGTFTIDWDTAQTLPEHDADVGRAEISYSRLTPTSGVTIGVEFTQVRDGETGALIDATYAYEKIPQAGGSFQFSVDKDLQNDGSQLEKLTIKSRWQPGGTGRSDVKATGGDLAAPATANECWDTNFLSTWLSASWNPQGGWGSESTCAFPTADYASL